MGQPLEMFVLQNDIIKAVLPRKKEKRNKRNNLPSNLHISPYDSHSVVVGKFSHFRQNLEKLIEIARRQILI